MIGLARKIDRWPFFVVWSPRGGPPVVQIAMFQGVRNAAHLLSVKHPDKDSLELKSCRGKLGHPPRATRPRPGRLRVVKYPRFKARMAYLAQALERQGL